MGEQMSEIDYDKYDRDDLLHFLKIRDRQAVMSREYWIRAARKAFGGDMGDLRNRVDLATMGPVMLTNGDTEFTLPGYEPPKD